MKEAIMVATHLQSTHVAVFVTDDFERSELTGARTDRLVSDRTSSLSFCHRARRFERLFREQFLVVDLFHERLCGSEKIVLLVFADPELGLDPRDALGQTLSLFISRIHQLSQRNMAHIAA